MSVHAKKSLGQNFLTDTFWRGRIAEAINPQQGEKLVEIGPGTGLLTEELLKRGALVTAVEKDSRCIEHLATLQAKYPGQLTLVEDDALRCNLLELVPQGSQLVGNLPYNVGTQIVINGLYQRPHWRRMVFLLQKEVVERICAEPDTNDWGRLGIFSQLLANCHNLFEVPPGAFSPPPKVTSAVVELLPLDTPRYDVPLKKLEQLTQQAFSQRRKMLRASLKGLLTEEQINAADIDPQRRPETLSLAEICKLTQQL